MWYNIYSCATDIYLIYMCTVMKTGEHRYVHPYDHMLQSIIVSFNDNTLEHFLSYLHHHGSALE